MSLATSAYTANYRLRYGFEAEMTSTFRPDRLERFLHLYRRHFFAPPMPSEFTPDRFAQPAAGSAPIIYVTAEQSDVLKAALLDAVEVVHMGELEELRI